MTRNLRHLIRRIILERVEESFVDAKLKYSGEVFSLSALKNRASPEIVSKSGSSIKQKTYAVRSRDEVYIFNEDAWHMPEKLRLGIISNNWYGAYYHVTADMSPEQKSVIYTKFGLPNNGDDRLLTADFDAYQAEIDELQRKNNEKLPAYMRSLKTTVPSGRKKVSATADTLPDGLADTLPGKKTTKESYGHKLRHDQNDVNIRRLRRIIREALETI